MKKLVVFFSIYAAFLFFNYEKTDAASNNIKGPFTGLIISWQQTKAKTSDQLFIRVHEQKAGIWTRWHQIAANTST